jgi:hypothetical protein
MERGDPGGTPLVLRMRRLWPDHNPLRRAADRAGFAIALLLAAGFLAGAPLLARWVSPAGPRTGTVIARPGERAGGSVMVWIDQAGRLTSPPEPAATVTYQVFLAALAAPAAAPQRNP